MLELVATVQIGIIHRPCLPHFPYDFQPSLAQGTQCAGVTLSFCAQRGVVSRSPRTTLATQVGPEVQRVAKKLVALATQMHTMNLAGLETHGRGARQALQCLRVGEQRTVDADLGQEPGRNLPARSG